MDYYPADEGNVAKETLLRGICINASEMARLMKYADRNDVGTQNHTSKDMYQICADSAGFRQILTHTTYHKENNLKILFTIAAF